MAFPTIVASAYWDSAGADVTAHYAAIPAGVQEGDLLLVLWGRESTNNGGTLDSNWTHLRAQGGSSAGHYRVSYRIADGTESGDWLFSTIVADRGASLTLLIRGWGALPVMDAIPAMTSTVTPNPASQTSGFGAVDTLWIAVSAIAAATRTATLPSGYGGLLQDDGSGPGLISIALGNRQTTAASEDAAAFTWSGAAALSLAAVVAVRGPVALTGSDSGGGADASDPTATHVRTDSGAATDVLPYRKLAVAEAGTGTERLGNRTLGAQDTAAAGDVATVEILGVVVETRPLPATLAEVLRTHHSPVARLLFLAADLDTVEHAIEATPEGDNRWLLTGSVSLDRTRDIYRQASAALANRDGTYSPTGPSSLVWPNRLVRIERGARIGDEAQYASLITGVLDDWHVGAATGVVEFTVWSRLTLADGQFGEPVTFAAGTSVGDVVRSVAEIAGLGTTDAFYVLDDDGLTLGDARTFDTRDNMLEAMVRTAFDNGLDLFDDGAGRLVLQPFADPSTTPVAWTFATGSEATLTDLSRGGRAGRVYNRAIVVGMGADRYPLRAEARVLNPNDPLYNPTDGTGPVGDRPRPTYQSSDVTSQQAALATAQRLLIEGALYEESLAAASSPVPIVGARDVVRFTGAGADDRYLLDRVTIPIGPGPMQMATRKVRSLLA